jgi:hypothetical protein
VPDREYRRIARPRARHKTVFSTLAIRSSLWIGEDHLLNIDSARYSEDYKRFYFRDIQAITIRTTQRRRVWNLVLGLLVIIWLGMLGNSLPPNVADTWTRAIFTAWFLLLAVLLLLNNVMGPTCATYIRTAVQTEELPSLNRVRRARKFLDVVRPLIVAAQQQQEPQQQQEHEEPSVPAPPTVKSSEVAAP